MIVRCVAEYPNQEQLEQLGPEFLGKRGFHITVGKEYIVFGLTVVFDANRVGRGIHLEHLTDYGHLVNTPGCLFQVVDGTAFPVLAGSSSE